MVPLGVPLKKPEVLCRRGLEARSSSHFIGQRARSADIVGSSQENTMASDAVEDGGYPEPCPICSRVNFRVPNDHCEHFWAAVYDCEVIDGPYATEFEHLWATLDNAYQSTDDEGARLLLRKLRQGGLTGVAKALVEGDKLWWLKRVKHKNFIDAEASMASGTGWNLYEEEAGWFEDTMRQLRSAVGFATDATS
jgi:hypothetical protein